MRHLGFLAFALVLAPALVHPAWAADGRATDQPLVLLTEEGRQDAEDTAFSSSVRTLAAELGIGVSTLDVRGFQAVRDTLLAQARRETKPFLVAWIVREDRTRKVHLFDPWKNQLRTRTVEAHASATVIAETLALILRAELLAYLNETPRPPEPSPPPTSPPPPPAIPDPRWSFPVAWAAGTFFRGQDILQGLRMGVEHRSSRRYLSAHYAYLLSQDVNTADVTMTIRRHPVDLDAGYAWLDHQWLRMVAEAFLSGDLVSRHTSSARTPLLAQPDERRFVISVGLRVRAELRVFRNLTVHIALGTEAPFNSHDFQITRGTTSSTVAQPSPVRVVGEAGMAVLTF